MAVNRVLLESARQRYADRGVDIDAAVAAMDAYPISLHCWQGDDVQGFESSGDALGGGLAVTGNYPGKARNGDELRADAAEAMRLIPGRHRFNLHAIYAETAGQPVARDALEPTHFQRWIDWASEYCEGLDFNPSYFAHPLASDGQTLAHTDPATRQFWIDHGIACRQIAEAMGAAFDPPCVTNFWVPDGSKDTPADRRGPRQRLLESLDAVFAEPIDPQHNVDAVESKLFGIGAESYTVGSHEFYLGYASSRDKLLCLDTGHFHPTEVVSDKLSAVMPWVPGVLLHVSRGVRWDSDHVVTLVDEVQAIAREIVRGDYGSRVHLGLDFFDATIHRVAAWVIGVRAMQKALLAAQLEPIEELRRAEESGDFTGRLVLMEEHKTLPVGIVWDYYCELNQTPPDGAWLAEVRRYEREVTSNRN